MSSSIPFKQYIGPSLLYQSINDHGFSPYLQRNIRQVLEAHEKELKTLSAKKGELSLPIRPEMGATLSRLFQMPKKEEFEAAIQASKPAYLRILPMAFEKTHVDYASDEESGTLEPDWLPAPSEIPITCSVQCLSSPSLKSPQILVDKNRQGLLVRRRDRNGQARFVFALDRPFHIDVERLFMTKDGGSSKHDLTWKNNEFVAKIMKVAVKFDRLDDAEEFECELGGGSKPITQPLELRTTWKSLPDCPLDGQLLKGSSIRNGVQQPLPGWGFRIDMAWSEPSESALAIYNQALHQSLGRPVSRDHLSAPERRKRYRIIYAYTGTALQSRSITKDDLTCIFCDSRLPFLTFESLHFHYIGYHDRFKFTISDRRKCPENTIAKTIQIDIAEPQRERASNHVSDEREIAWVRPEEPFDLKRYLDKDDRSWINLRPGKRLKVHDQMNSRVTESPSASSIDNDYAEPAKMYQKAVELPVERRKTYKVSELPGVTFFRTASKRPIQHGEFLEESDAENDNSWLESRHIKNSASLPNDSAIRSFTIVYDDYMKSEDLHGVKYLPHTLLRFCRKQAQFLCDPHMSRALQTKLAHLVLSGLITEKTKSHCLETLDYCSQQDNTIAETFTAHYLDGLRDKDTMMVDSIDRASNVSEASTLRQPGTPGTHDMQSTKPLVGTVTPQSYVQPRIALCVCGKACTSAKDIVFCANTRCPRNEFHLKCVGLPKRVPEWKCPECRSAKSTSVAPVAVM